MTEADPFNRRLNVKARYGGYAQRLINWRGTKRCRSSVPPDADPVSGSLFRLSLASTGNPSWFEATLWLLGARLIMAALAAVAGLIDILRGARIGSLKAASWHAGGNLLAVLIELHNWLRTLQRRQQHSAAERDDPLGVVVAPYSSRRSQSLVCHSLTSAQPTNGK